MSFFDDLAKNIPILIDKIAVLSIEELDIQMQQRIFEEGVDSDGVLLKNGDEYADLTKKIRLQAGRQINKIDLQFTGDMRRSIINAKSTEGQNLIFSSATQSEKREEIEDLFNQDIFSPSSQESENVLNLFQNLFNESINELAERAKN